MCQFVEAPADSFYGRILQLDLTEPLELRLLHFQDFILYNEEPDDPDYEEDGAAEPLTSNLVGAFFSTAKTVVTELLYFDMDYRSEFGRLQEVAFAPAGQEVSRVHFFGDAAESDQDKPRSVALREFVSTSKSYLGYIVVRPQSVGTFGRSLVTTHAAIDDGRIDPDAAELRIRTSVREVVQLFGVDLEAVGVPFMEQDGRLLRCAHVSAWMCHYAGVLRGDVPRRLSGHFHSNDISVESVGRPFPSQGLTVPMMSALLRTVDLPPEVVDEAALIKGRQLIEPADGGPKTPDWYWSDHQKLIDAIDVAGHLFDKDDKGLSEEERKREIQRVRRKHWARYNLTATVARYVNSGIPVILAREASEHTQVVIGYLRASDRGEADTIDGEYQNPVVALIASDDQVGPYEIIEVDELVEQIMKGTFGVSLVIPLPRSLWMPGHVAEHLAVNWLEVLVEEQLEEAVGDKSALAEFSERMNEQGAMTIRTFMIEGTEFKRSVQSRLEDPEVIRGVGLMQLPRYVWVVEVQDRPVDAPTPDARAMIVFDPTAPGGRDDVSANFLESEPLFVYLPGRAFVTPSPWYGESDADGWFSSKVETFESGRRGHAPRSGRTSGKSAVALTGR